MCSRISVNKSGLVSEYERKNYEFRWNLQKLLKHHYFNASALELIFFSAAIHNMLLNCLCYVRNAQNIA